MVGPHGSNFRVITTNVLGFQIFGKFTVIGLHLLQPTFPDMYTGSCILQVTPGSLAAKCGLLQGDVILKIGNKSSDTLKHKDAQDAILQYGNKLDLLLQR